LYISAFFTDNKEKYSDKADDRILFQKPPEERFLWDFASLYIYHYIGVFLLEFRVRLDPVMRKKNWFKFPSIFCLRITFYNLRKKEYKKS